jgi:hypothetical protein
VKRIKNDIQTKSEQRTDIQIQNKMFNNNPEAEEAIETLTIRGYVNYKGTIKNFEA